MTQNAKVNARRLVAAALLAAAAAGLGAAPASAEAKPPKGRVVKIGYAQFIEHPMLDETRRGLLDGLKAAGFEQAKTMIFDYEYADNDFGKARTIAAQLVADKVDLVAPCSGPDVAASIEAAAGNKIPVVFGCVVNPVEAGFLKSADRPTGSTITGIYAVPPIKESFDLFLQIKPGLKRLGTLYNTAQRDSAALDRAARAEAARRGIDWVEVTVTSSAAVKAAADSLAGKVDALVILRDYTVAWAYDAVVKAARDAHLPLFAFDGAAVGRGAIAALAENPYQTGLDWARLLVVPVLRGKDPGTLKPVRVTHYDLKVDLDAAKAAGVTIPPALVKKAVK